MVEKVMARYKLDPEKPNPFKFRKASWLEVLLLVDLGEGIEGADVSEVVVSVGDTVAKDDTF